MRTVFECSTRPFRDGRGNHHNLGVGVSTTARCRSSGLNLRPGLKGHTVSIRLAGIDAPEASVLEHIAPDHANGL
jgi:endonuclease YncB( thermonuclease family)